MSLVFSTSSNVENVRFCKGSVVYTIILRLVHTVVHSITTSLRSAIGHMQQVSSVS